MNIGIIGLGLIGGSMARAYALEGHTVLACEKDEHMLFLEPEGETTNEMYLNGFSSSLPLNVQLAALRQIPAFRNLDVYRPGYAIEYDFMPPEQT
mgnify:CR=1 FL=1